MQVNAEQRVGQLNDFTATIGRHPGQGLSDDGDDDYPRSDAAPCCASGCLITRGVNLTATE